MFQSFTQLEIKLINLIKLSLSEILSALEL